LSRGVGQIYAAAVMLTLMMATLIVGLSLEGDLMQAVQGHMKSINVEEQRMLERLQVVRSQGGLTVRNVGTVPVTIAYIHTLSTDTSVGATLGPGDVWIGAAPDNEGDSFVITAKGNVFTTQSSVPSQSALTYPAATQLLYSPLQPGRYYIVNPLYGNAVGAVTELTPNGSADWTVVYLPHAVGSPTSSSSWLAPSSDPNYTFFYTIWYFNGYGVNVTAYRLQAPLSQDVAVSNSVGIKLKAGTQGLLILDARYAGYSQRDCFWTIYRPISPTGSALPPYDPGAFPSRSYERFYGNALALSNGSSVAEFGFGTSYSYSTTGTYPTQPYYPYSSMFIRLIRWTPTALQQVAFYNVSGNYPSFPYLADDLNAWDSAGCVYADKLAVRVNMRNASNYYTLLDVYDLDDGRLLARKALSTDVYGGPSVMPRTYHMGFIDGDKVLLQDDSRGLLQVLSISGNLSVVASALTSTIQTYAKLGGASPQTTFDYTTVTDYYLLPGSGIAYPCYAGVFFYDSNLALTRAVWFDGYQPQPKSPSPLVLTQDQTVIVLVADPSGNSYVKVFPP
jgi:hypothetical protein